MVKLAFTIFRIRAAYGANGIIYFLKRIPLLKWILPDSLYSEGALKEVITFVVSICDILLSFIYKVLYVFLIIMLPASFLIFDTFKLNGLFQSCVHLFFWLSCVSVLFYDSEILKATRQKYICIKYMRVRPKDYMRATFPVQRGLLFITFLPSIALMTLLTGGTGLDVFKLWLMLISFRLASEALQLWAYKHFKMSLLRNSKVVIAGVIIGISAGYLPLIFQWKLTYISLLTGPVGMGIVSLLLFLSIWYIFIKYDFYHTAILANLKQEYVVADTKKASKAAFKSVEMKETDLTLGSHSEQSIKNKSGYAYLQKLFFARHRRLLWRPVLLRVQIIGGLVLVCGIGLIAEKAGILPLPVSKLVLAIPKKMSALVLLMYFINMADKACKAMFYNCDNSMLTFSFYRKADVIIKNFNIRLRYVTGYNMLISLSICIGTMVLLGLAGGGVFSAKMLAFYGCVMILSVLFSVHYLFLYYVMQPYTSDLTVKNPVYTIIYQLMYLVCFFCYHYGKANMMFILVVIAATVIYTTVALALVYRLSPKYFRIK